MTDDIAILLDRIASGSYTDADLVALRRAILVGGQGNVVQVGKYNIQIDEMGPIHIGPTIYQELDAETIKRAVREIMAQLQLNQLVELLSQSHQDISLPDVTLVNTYLEQVAAQKPYSLWTNEAYIDRVVDGTDEPYPRSVVPFTPSGLELVRHPAPEPLEVVLERERRLVLIGEPGLGKTTSMLHLAWEAATHRVTKEGSPNMGQPTPQDKEPEATIPVYVELKYYDDEHNLETLLVNRINEILRARNRVLALDEFECKRIFRNWLAHSDSRFLLLLDGLNEVPPQYHTAVRGEIAALLNSSHRIVVSCREHDYDRSLHDRAAAFILKPLQADEVRDFLEKGLGEKGRVLFESYIRWDSKMLTLAANPLMLWLISITARTGAEARLPSNRGQLFRQFAVQMPGLRRQEGIRTHVAVDVVVTALSGIAIEMQRRGRLVADLGDIRGWQIPASGQRLEKVLAQAKEWRFLKSDGVSGEPVAFLHQLFLEYFAAVYLDRASQDGGSYAHTVGQHLGSRTAHAEIGTMADASVVVDWSRWNEVMVMLAGITEQPDELVRWLADVAVHGKHRDVPLLAYYCWNTSAAKRDGEARAAVIHALTGLLDSVDRYDYDRLHAIKALGEIGDRRSAAPLVSLFRRSKWEYTRIFCAYALGLIADLQAANPLVEALDDTQTDAEVCGWILQALGRIYSRNTNRDRET